MMQALGIFAAGFLLHYILNRPMIPVTPDQDEEDGTIPVMPPSDTPPTLAVYVNGAYSLMDLAGGTDLADSDPGGQRYVIFEGGSSVKGPDGRAAYVYPGTQAGLDEGIRVVDVLATPDDEPPALPEPSPTPPQDLPGMPGSSGGLGGGVGSSLSDSNPPSDDDVDLNIGIGTDARKELIGSMKYGNDFPGLGVY